MVNCLHPVKYTLMVLKASGVMLKKDLLSSMAYLNNISPLYLKEMEFRYNNRHNILFHLIVRKLCFLVSNLL